MTDGTDRRHNLLRPRGMLSAKFFDFIVSNRILKLFAVPIAAAISPHIYYATCARNSNWLIPLSKASAPGFQTAASVSQRTCHRDASPNAMN